jgi:hypothetical protein
VGNNDLERWKNPMVSLLDIVLGFAWWKDLERYAGGSVATGRASHSGEVEGDDPDEYGYPGPPGWVGHEADILIPLKKLMLRKAQNASERIDKQDNLAIRKRIWFLVHGTFERFKTGAWISLLSQLKQYRLNITGLQGTSWQGKDIIDVK